MRSVLDFAPIFEFDLPPGRESAFPTQITFQITKGPQRVLVYILPAAVYSEWFSLFSYFVNHSGPAQFLQVERGNHIFLQHYFLPLIYYQIFCGFNDLLWDDSLLHNLHFQVDPRWSAGVDHLYKPTLMPSLLFSFNITYLKRYKNRDCCAAHMC